MYKGIVLAGGQGTRLYPSSLVVSKQLLNVYDKPLIYYPICTMMIAGIKDILVISSPGYIDQYMELLGDGGQWGIKLQYMVQEEPRGIAECFLLAEEFIGKSNVCLMLGDNILYGNNLMDILESCQVSEGAKIISYPVTDPERFGVVECDHENNVISIEEKPSYPKSNRAIIGLYFFDNNVVNYVKEITPSSRGELEVTDLHQIYLKKGNLKVENLKRGMVWFDAGTFDSLLTASNFIATVEKVQGYKICCPEEIAYRRKWITLDQLFELSLQFMKSGYGEYLNTIYEEEK